MTDSRKAAFVSVFLFLVTASSLGGCAGAPPEAVVPAGSRLTEHSRVKVVEGNYVGPVPSLPGPPAVSHGSDTGPENRSSKSLDRASRQERVAEDTAAAPRPVPREHVFKEVLPPPPSAPRPPSIGGIGVFDPSSMSGKAHGLDTFDPTASKIGN
jgi:hypothetical protein